MLDHVSCVFDTAGFGEIGETKINMENWQDNVCEQYSTEQIIIITIIIIF